MIVPKTFGNLKSIDDGYDERLYKWKRVCLEYTQFSYVDTRINTGRLFLRKKTYYSIKRKIVFK
jgi:hypothetical protein